MKLTKNKTIKEYVQVLEYKGLGRGKLVAEMIDALTYLMEAERVIIVDEEQNGGCTSIFMGTPNVANQVCDYLEEIEVPYSLLSKTNHGEGRVQ